MMRRSCRAFTLVELLVVIAIIGILIALLLPAVQAAREAARRAQCVNNLSQLVVAVHNYEMAHRFYPPGTINATGPIVNAPRGYHHNWIIQLLPYMEEGNTWRHIDKDVSVYHKNNRKVRGVNIATLQCPSAPRMGSTSNYAGVHHDVEAPIDVTNHGVFFLNSRVAYDDITDGSSHTLFIGEKLIDANELGWMSGTRATLRNTGVAINTTGLPRTVPGPGFLNDLIESEDQDSESSDAVSPQEPGDATDASAESAGGGSASKDIGSGQGGPALVAVGGFASEHPAGANFALGDGSVRFFGAMVGLPLLQQLAHRADGKLMGSGDF